MSIAFTAEGFNTIAQCISRGEHLTIEFGELTGISLWCATCKETSTITATVYGISDKGIYSLGEMTVCTTPTCATHKAPEDES